MDQATRRARAVALIPQEAATTGEMDDVRIQLKPEHEELLGRQDEQMNPTSALQTRRPSNKLAAL